MHEMSIAEALLPSVLDALPAGQAVRVEQIELAVGAMRLVVAEALELAWSVTAEGTPAAGARLKVTEVPLKARCRRCGGEFHPAIDNYLCPTCGQADVDIIEGDDIILQSVTCLGQQGADGP